MRYLFRHTGNRPNRPTSKSSQTLNSLSDTSISNSIFESKERSKYLATDILFQSPRFLMSIKENFALNRAVALPRRSECEVNDSRPISIYECLILVHNQSYVHRTILSPHLYEIKKRTTANSQCSDNESVQLLLCLAREWSIGLWPPK